MTEATVGDRFAMSPRRITDADWFGLEANESGTVNVPFEDPYQGLAYPEYAGETPGKAPVIMSGETTVTIIGNLTADPQLRYTKAGAAVTNFTIATTPRTTAALGNDGDPGETMFLRSTLWREAAKNAAASLTKGTRVIAAGRIKPRTYETKTGQKRTVLELEIDEIGPSLRYAATKINRTERSTQDSQNPDHGTAT